ncbi:uncharacterized protein LOC107461247 [Arachis duranensis]|uniref:Uncharacterized protein LOC107461247 n=1 Tax=Arachis duranensis TaxID=130453 RepID=A0A6P5MJK2_ARADU|nr:uncharacterized protein LOC107461247 [Arachis duranensis]
MAATTSSSCSGFFSLRSSNTADETRVVRDISSSSSSSSSSSGCGGGGKLDGVAMWFINGVTMAFFASLNRCSCIRIATDEEDDGEDANDLPLMFNDGNIRHDGVSAVGTASRRRTGKGKKNKNSNNNGVVEQDY